MEDLELLDAWQAGEKAAGSELLRRYFQPLYRFFCNKVDKGAEDLIQNTMLACVRGRDKYRREGSFRSFLFSVARHELLHHFRSRNRDRLVFDPEVSSVLDLGPSPSSAMAKAREQQLLLRALRAIPVDLQIALELHYWEDLSTRELADALGIPQGTVKSRLRRARTLLEERLTELATGKDVLCSTLDDLERWARSIRREVVAAAG